MSDLRTSRDRDASLYAQIDRDGGISLTKFVSNRDNAASLHRLICSGAVRIEADWIGVGKPLSGWRAWVDRVVTFFVGRAGA